MHGYHVANVLLLYKKNVAKVYLCNEQERRLRPLPSAALQLHQPLAKFDVAVMCRVEHDEFHLLHVGLAVLSQIVLIHKDVDYLSHDVIAFS